jgi:hypothetical protein
MTGEQATTAARPEGPPAYSRAYERPGRRHKMLVRLSDEEKRLIDAAARQAQLTPTGYTAKAAVAAASADAGVSSGDLRELQRELFAARRAVNMFASNVNQAATAYNAADKLPDWVDDAVQLTAAAVSRLDEVTARIDRRLR